MPKLPGLHALIKNKNIQVKRNSYVSESTLEYYAKLAKEYHKLINEIELLKEENIKLKEEEYSNENRIRIMKDDYDFCYKNSKRVFKENQYMKKELKLMTDAYENSLKLIRELNEMNLKFHRTLLNKIK